MKKCSSPLGIPYRPDGKNELDPCRYETEEIWKNVAVRVMKCRKCGNKEISWYMQENTEQLNPESFESEIDVPVIGGGNER